MKQIREWRAVPLSIVLLIVALSVWPAHSANAQTVTFDFDTGVPALSTGQNLPLDQLSGGITAHFSSPTVGAGGFSVQSDATTQYRLSQFSGNYLWPNSVYNPALEIQFSQPLTSITFTFATADFQQVEIPTTIQLTAYLDAAGAVGSATAHGTYAGDTMPMGTLAFNADTSFNLVRIEIPYAPMAASGFLVDNITVRAALPSPTVTPSTTPTATPVPALCIGDCDGGGTVTVNELIVLVNMVLGTQTQLSACARGLPPDLTDVSQMNVALIIQAVIGALNGCGPH
jgi:hypothetical protein